MPGDEATPDTNLPSDDYTSGSDDSEPKMGTPEGDPDNATGAASGAGSGHMDPDRPAGDHGRHDTSDNVEAESPGRADAQRPPRGSAPA
ncbi:MAG: hypothetical protein LC720_04165 [Actinobacteria bacterium]|nr:hypothetical protein [Actinomycetota bacterium]